MKKLFLFSLLSLFVFGCSSSDDNSEPTLELSKLTLTFPYSAKTETVKVESNTDWSAEITPASATSWLSITPDTGRGETMVSVQATANPDDENGRSATITFRAGTQTKTIQVDQKKQSALILSQGTYDLEPEKTTIEVEINTNVKFDVSIPNADQTWIKQVETKAMEKHILRFEIGFNNSYESRTSEIRFTSDDLDYSEKITINQKGGNFLSVFPGTFALGGGVGTIEVEALSNVTYTVEIPEDSKGWISEVKTKNVTEKKYNFSISHNGTGAPRTSEIRFIAENDDYSITVPVTQNVPLAEISTSHAGVDFVATAFEPVIVNVTSNNPNWTQSVTSDNTPWCHAHQEGDDLIVYAEPNFSASTREAKVTLSANGKTTEVAVSQEAFKETGSYSDRDLIMFQKSKSPGKGIPLVLLGDGFTKDHLDKGGKYVKSVLEAMQHFFSVPPYKTYRHYFDVYVVIGESSTSTITASKSNGMKFGSHYPKGVNNPSTSIDCNETMVYKYVNLVPGLEKLRETSSTADYKTVVGPSSIVVINDSRYKGTCLMGLNGFSISLCPMSTVNNTHQSFKGLVLHEAGGHGFGKFADEYRYTTGPIPIEDKEDVLWAQENLDFFFNIGFEGDYSKCAWNFFQPYSQYNDIVSTFEGAYFVTKGVWRAERNQVMNDNIDYYNALCRWLIFEKIMKAAELPYTFEQFVEEDILVEPTYGSREDMTRTRNDDFIPLAPPIIR